MSLCDATTGAGDSESYDSENNESRGSRIGAAHLQGCRRRVTTCLRYAAVVERLAFVASRNNNAVLGLLWCAIAPMSQMTDRVSYNNCCDDC